MCISSLRNATSQTVFELPAAWVNWAIVPEDSQENCDSQTVIFTGKEGIGELNVNETS